jgi:hypothetical protein
MDRKLDATTGNITAPVYTPVGSAAFGRDPFFAYTEQTGHGPFCCAPVLHDMHMLACERFLAVSSRTIRRLQVLVVL